MMTKENLTKQDWIDLLEPDLGRSMRKVSELMTNVPAVQRWIRSASYEVALQTSQQAGVQAQTDAYSALRDDLTAEFTPLAEAVRELTRRNAHLDVKWRPLSPNYTRLFICFDVDYEIDVFVVLKAASSAEAQRALDVAAAALPRSEPFPNRPNERTALVVLHEQRLGVRVREQQAETETGRRRTVTIFPEGEPPDRDLPFAEAPDRMVQYLAPEDGSRMDPATWM